MDIALLDTTTLSEEGVAMKIRDPRVTRDFEKDSDTRPFLLDASGEPVTITLLGPDNPKVARMMLPQRARFQTAALAAQGRKGVTFTADDVTRDERETLDIVVAATVTWAGFTNGDAVHPCTAEHARALYKTSTDIRDQAMAFIRDRGNFLPSVLTD